MLRGIKYCCKHLHSIKCSECFELEEKMARSRNHDKFFKNLCRFSFAGKKLGTQEKTVMREAADSGATGGDHSFSEASW